MPAMTIYLRFCIGQYRCDRLLPCRALADTRQVGKLTREQFALAMHLIQQKVSKGVDPPQALSADMIPPSERGTPIQVGSSRTTHKTKHSCLVSMSARGHSEVTHSMNDLVLASSSFWLFSLQYLVKLKPANANSVLSKLKRLEYALLPLFNQRLLCRLFMSNVWTGSSEKPAADSFFPFISTVCYCRACQDTWLPSGQRWDGYVGGVSSFVLQFNFQVSDPFIVKLLEDSTQLLFSLILTPSSLRLQTPTHG